MSVIAKTRLASASLSLVALSAGVAAQQSGDPTVIVNGRRAEAPATVPGPEIKGVITARHGDRIKVAGADGRSTIVAVTAATRIKASGGLFGGGRDGLGPDSLLNGLRVTVKTAQPVDGAADGRLLASQIAFRASDLKTASMISNATAQRFDEQHAATEALRGRLGDIDKYNVKSTTDVHFDTGRTDLSAADKASLCATATSAQATENALLLVVGYTDSVGSDEINQQLSEKRAGRVINYLQQVCGWKPYRMLTPTGMAKADPAASNMTAAGKAQNRRVSVNILVSKSVDGM